MQRLPRERTSQHNALIFAMIDKLPALRVIVASPNWLVQMRTEAASSPEVTSKIWLEAEWHCEHRPLSSRLGVHAQRASKDTYMDELKGFVVEEGRGIYRPVGTVSFDEAVALIRAAIAAARAHQVPQLLVDTTALDGFPSPD